VLQRAKERNILQAIKRRSDNWMGFVLHRNCLLKRVTEGRIKVMGRRRRRRSRRRRRRRRRSGGGSGDRRRRRILRKRKATVN
jgi:hypothetical protein